MWQGRVALVLALGIVVAITLVTAGILYDAIFSQGPGISDNAAAILTTAFGGMIGVLGSYIGYSTANGAKAKDKTQGANAQKQNVNGDTK